MLAGFLTVRCSLGVRHLGDLCFDWWLVEQHSSPRSADVALAYRVRNGNRMAVDSVTPWMERPFQVTRVTGPPHPGLVTAAVHLQGGPVRACFACSLIVECEGSGWVGGLWAFGASSSTVRCHGAAQPEGMKERGSGRRGTVEA